LAKEELHRPLGKQEAHVQKYGINHKSPGLSPLEAFQHPASFEFLEVPARPFEIDALVLLIFGAENILHFGQKPGDLHPMFDQIPGPVLLQNPAAFQPGDELRRLPAVVDEFPDRFGGGVDENRGFHPLILLVAGRINSNDHLSSAQPAQVGFSRLESKKLIPSKERSAKKGKRRHKKQKKGFQSAPFQIISIAKYHCTIISPFACLNKGGGNPLKARQGSGLRI